MRQEVVSTKSGVLGVVHIPERRTSETILLVIPGASSDCFDGFVWDLCSAISDQGALAVGVNLSARGLGRCHRSLRQFRGWPWQSLDESLGELSSLSEYCQSNFGGKIALAGHSWGALVCGAAAELVGACGLALASPVASGRLMVELLFDSPDRTVSDAVEMVSAGQSEELLRTSTTRRSIPFICARSLVELWTDERLDLINGLDSMRLPIAIVTGSREHTGVGLLGDRIEAQTPSLRQHIIVPGATHFYRGCETVAADALLASLTRLLVTDVAGHD